MTASEAARRLHRDSVVADTHNDLILLVDHYDRRGRPEYFREFWLPELRAGGLKVQVLPIWVDDLFQSEGGLRRTLLLAERIHRLAAEHPDDVAVCVTAAEVDAAVVSGRIALVIALEGAHGLGQDPDLIRTMWRVGVRVVSLAHVGRTMLADGSGLDATARGGLTPEGLTVLAEMERLGIVFDVSHLGVRGVDDVLEHATRPLLATHSACRVITDVHRNLSDEQIRGIAGLGGVIGVAAAIPQFIDGAAPTVERVVDHIDHLVTVAGVDHVGIGADFIDDYYEDIFGGWPGRGGQQVDAPLRRPSELPELTDALLARGYDEDDVRKILGENVMRVVRSVLGIPTA
jgi:membrane dipeptidase